MTDSHAAAVTEETCASFNSADQFTVRVGCHCSAVLSSQLPLAHNVEALVRERLAVEPRLQHVLRVPDVSAHTFCRCVGGFASISMALEVCPFIQ